MRASTCASGMSLPISRNSSQRYSFAHYRLAQYHANYSIILLQYGHVFVRPINDNCLQLRQAIGDGDNFHRRLSALTHAHLCFRVLQHIGAGFGRICGVNTCSHAAGHPRPLQTEVVFRRVKANHSAHVMGLHSYLQQRLGKSRLNNMRKAYFIDSL